MSDFMPCRGCGELFDTGGGPQPDRCESCPPIKCPDCGQIDAMTAPCGCWVSVSDMSLADLKGLFATGGLSVGPAPDFEATQ